MPLLFVGSCLSVLFVGYDSNMMRYLSVDNNDDVGGDDDDDDDDYDDDDDDGDGNDGEPSNMPLVSYSPREQPLAMPMKCRGATNLLQLLEQLWLRSLAAWLGILSSSKTCLFPWHETSKRMGLMSHKQSSTTS